MPSEAVDPAPDSLSGPLYNRCMGGLEAGRRRARISPVDAALGGKEFKFSLTEALKKGPSGSLTSIQIIHERLHGRGAMNSPKTSRFRAAGASVIGLSGDKNRGSARLFDQRMPRQIPVGADPSFSVIKAYDAASTFRLLARLRQNRISYVISPEGKILYAYSDSNAEKHIGEYAGRHQEMARGAQALIVRVSLGHILLTPAKSQEHTSDFLDRHLTILLVAANVTTFRRRRRRYDTLATDATRRRCTIRSVARSTISDGTLVFLLTSGRTHLHLNKYAPALRAV